MVTCSLLVPGKSVSKASVDSEYFRNTYLLLSIDCRRMPELIYEANGFRSSMIPSRLPSESRIHMSQTSAWGSLAITRGS